MKPLLLLSLTSALLILLGCEPLGGALKTVPLVNPIEEETLTSALEDLDSDGDIGFRYSSGDPLYYVDSINVCLNRTKTNQILELTRIGWLISEDEAMRYCNQIDALYERIRALIPYLPPCSEHPTKITGYVIKSRRDYALQNIVYKYIMFGINRARAP